MSASRAWRARYSSRHRIRDGKRVEGGVRRRLGENLRRLARARVGGERGARLQAGGGAGAPSAPRTARARQSPSPRLPWPPARRAPFGTRPPATRATGRASPPAEARESEGASFSFFNAKEGFVSSASRSSRSGSRARGLGSKSLRARPTGGITVAVTASLKYPFADQVQLPPGGPKVLPQALRVGERPTFFRKQRNRCDSFARGVTASLVVCARAREPHRSSSGPHVASGTDVEGNAPSPTPRIATPTLENRKRKNRDEDADRARESMWWKTYNEERAARTPPHAQRCRTHRTFWPPPWSPRARARARAFPARTPRARPPRAPTSGRRFLQSRRGRAGERIRGRVRDRQQRGVPGRQAPHAGGRRRGRAGGRAFEPPQSHERHVVQAQAVAGRLRRPRPARHARGSGLGNKSRCPSRCRPTVRARRRPTQTSPSWSSCWTPTQTTGTRTSSPQDAAARAAGREPSRTARGSRTPSSRRTSTSKPPSTPDTRSCSSRAARAGWAPCAPRWSGPSWRATRTSTP